MADNTPFDPEDANLVAMSLAAVVATASHTFGGYAMIGGVMKFNVDFIGAGIEHGEMDITLMRLLKLTHELVAKMLNEELERRAKEVN